MTNTANNSRLTANSILFNNTDMYSNLNSTLGIDKVFVENKKTNGFDMETYLKFRICLCWISLFLIFIGLVGNFISFIILINKKMRISTNVFLASLCVSGFIALLGLSINSVIYELLIYYQNDTIHVLYRFYPYVYPITNTFQMASILLTVCVSVNQFITIYSSKAQVKTKKSTDDECKTALIVVVIMYVISIIYCIPYWLKFKYTQEFGFHLTKIGQDPLFNKIVHFWMYLPIVYIIPFSILIFTNAYLVYTIMIARKRRKRLENASRKNKEKSSVIVNKKNNNDESKSETAKPFLNQTQNLPAPINSGQANSNHEKKFSIVQEKEENESPNRKNSKPSVSFAKSTQLNKSVSKKAGGMNITIMLIAVVFLFFICQFPNLIIHIIQSMLCSIENKRCISSGLYQYSLAICKMLLIVNLSFNFACYCLFSEKFRQVLKETFGFSKKTANNSVTVQNKTNK